MSNFSDVDKWNVKVSSQCFISPPGYEYTCGTLGKNVSLKSLKSCFRSKVKAKYKYNPAHYHSNPTYPKYIGFVIGKKFGKSYTPKTRMKLDADDSKFKTDKNGSPIFEIHEQDLYSTGPNQARLLSMEATDSAPVLEFCTAVKEGFRICNAESCLQQTCWEMYKLEGNQFGREVICTILQQQLVYNHLFWTNKHNKDLAFDVDDDGNLKFKDLTDVKFSEWIIPRIPTGQQIYINAARQYPDKSIYIRYILFTLCLVMMILVLLLLC